MGNGAWLTGGGHGGKILEVMLVWVLLLSCEQAEAHTPAAMHRASQFCLPIFETMSPNKPFLPYADFFWVFCRNKKKSS